MKFKSYCWCIGTTSFRVDNLNYKIEKQLLMLDKLWKTNPNMTWAQLQETYYDIMASEKFVKGTATRKAKDAREITSGLVNIGVIDEGRKITEVGMAIKALTDEADFSSNNIFNIDKDSYIYLKQFLKYEVPGNEFNIRPFIALVYLLSELDYLTKEEFTYLLPICKNHDEVKQMVFYINRLRDSSITIDEILYKKMMNMNNYYEILQYFLKNNFNSKEEFATIGINRKSIKYDYIYFDIYNSILYCINNKKSKNNEKVLAIKKLKNDINKLSNSKVKKYWVNYFEFNNRRYKDNSVEYINLIYSKPIFNFKTEEEMKVEFFKIMHLSKWKATLEDYYDLNKRYFSLTDILIFEDEKIQLDILPKFYFKRIYKDLLEEELYGQGTDEYKNFFFSNLDLENIYDCIILDLDNVVKDIQAVYHNYEISIENVNEFIEKDRIRRFNKFIDEKFDNNNLIKLLKLINDRKDKQVKDYTEWDADIPTIFEYITAIAWYKISNRRGNILKYMNLSLDSNLYPKKHAVGGVADIIYEYKKTDYYPKHDLLIEVTLTDSTQQRRAEMEPVSRHLIMHKNKTKNEEDYAVFIAPYLHPLVLSDFRSRRNFYYEKEDGTITKGLKIIPLSVENIIYILENHIKYERLYEEFDKIFKIEELNDIEWYEKAINKKYS